MVQNKIVIITCPFRPICVRRPMFEYEADQSRLCFLGVCFLSVNLEEFKEKAYLLLDDNTES